MDLNFGLINLCVSIFFLNYCVKIPADCGARSIGGDILIESDRILLPNHWPAKEKMYFSFAITFCLDLYLHKFVIK